MGNTANKSLESVSTNSPGSKKSLPSTNSITPATSTIPSLPLDIWFIIIAFVDFEERDKLALVNHEFQKFIHKNKDLWFEKDFSEAVKEAERLSPPPEFLGTITIYHQEKEGSIDIYNSMYWPKFDIEKKILELFPDQKGNYILGLHEKNINGTLINIKGGMSNIFESLKHLESQYYVELFRTGSVSAIQWRKDRDRHDRKLIIEELKNWKKMKKEWDQGWRICKICAERIHISILDVDSEMPVLCHHVVEAEISLDHHICIRLGHPI